MIQSIKHPILHLRLLAGSATFFYRMNIIDMIEPWRFDPNMKDYLFWIIGANSFLKLMEKQSL